MLQADRHEYGLKSLFSFWVRVFVLGSAKHGRAVVCSGGWSRMEGRRPAILGMITKPMFIIVSFNACTTTFLCAIVTNYNVYCSAASGS